MFWESRKEQSLYRRTPVCKEVDPGADTIPTKGENPGGFGAHLLYILVCYVHEGGSIPRSTDDGPNIVLAP